MRFAEARARPRKWAVFDGDQLVRFVMLSDNVPPEVYEGDDELVGRYFLWRLLIDHRFQRCGYGAATIDAVVDFLRANSPDADILYTSCVPGEGTLQPFYERYGFVATGEVVDGEVVLGLQLRAR